MLARDGIIHVELQNESVLRVYYLDADIEAVFVVRKADELLHRLRRVVLGGVPQVAELQWILIDL